MLAGLIFATEDADDRAGTLAETLPFGGQTLIEFQVRLLLAAGASHIILVVERMTPELLGAVSRIGRRGASVDAVRSARDVMEKLHPLARILVVADGVVTTGDVIATLATAPGDTLLVTDQGNPRYERVGALTAWAGLALLHGSCIAEVAALPADYDFQSTLLRVAAQGGADQLRLTPALATHHAIERNTVALAARGGATLTALLARPQRWAERFVALPLARLALPLLLGRSVPSLAVAAGASVLGLAGLAAIFLSHPAAGLAVVIVGALLGEIASALAVVRDERPFARAFQWLGAGMVGAGALLIGWGGPHPTGLVLASAALIAAALTERAAIPPSAIVVGQPLAYPLVLLPLLIAGEPLVALAAAALYGVATLAAAIEAFREKP